MTRLTILTLAALAALAGPALAQTKVGVAAEAYPPFTVPSATGEWTGWEIEIADALCAAAELTCETTPVAWDGIIPALTSGKIDLIVSSMSITAERAKVIDFSEKYYNTPTSVASAKGGGIKATPEGLAGKSLGVQVSTVHQNYAEKHFPDAEIKVYQTQDEANQDLYAGRIDATQADAIAIDAFLASPEGQSCCELAGEVAEDLEVLGEGVGVGMRQGDPLKDKINAAIEKIRADGTYDTISKKYFDFDIYGK